MRMISDLAFTKRKVIGMSAVGYGLKKTSNQKVPETLPASWIHATPGPTIPEQYLIGEK